MSIILTKLKSFLSQKPGYEQFIDSAHNMKESEDRMRSLGTLNANLLYLSKC